MAGPALVIAGTAHRVRRGSWRVLPSLWSGADVRVDNMAVISTVDPDSEIRVRECEVFYTDDAALLALHTSIPRGTAVVVSGYLLEVPMSAYVTVTGGGAIHKKEAGVASVNRFVSLHIEQAEPAPGI